MVGAEAGAAGQGGGAAYSYLDLSAQAGTVYTYWLADVDTDGGRTIHGPVTAPPVFGVQLSALYQMAGILEPYG